MMTAEAGKATSTVANLAQHGHKYFALYPLFVPSYGH